MSKIHKTGTIKKNSSGNYQRTCKPGDAEQKKRVTMSPSNEVIMFGQDHIVEVTVRKKNQGQKRTSPVVSCNHEQKAEKIRSMTTDNNTPPNWGNVFNQNLLHVSKQHSSKQSGKEAEKNINAKKQQKSTVKHDCAVQCSDYDFNKLITDFNPLHMLHLIKQLKDLVNKNDKRICEIFTEMEQILQKVPDLETKAEFNAVPLKESSKKIRTVSYESFILEREKLKSEIQERDERLKEVDQKYADLKFQVERLTQQLKEATYKKNDTMSRLMQQIENNERTITDLKTNLNKQTELARKNDIDNEYLTMEINKLSKLSSYKDAQITDYRNTIQLVYYTFYF
ncbi:PREDICTED: putative leucine-rich repeat-containing protein DDB_G0290503 [Cyphomyrmex costatus]|uniref:putative leucine-rich repeat-containing protein DDB_G0290503 n=1 Tax=Cyphomyrmex costatus TaxID=456900 RepID=UPI000852218A|nr:PREDICTED: putative leucine-rich repeat-containing protein DDB_G0290503 [Cyphomyrmex costatus]